MTAEVIPIRWEPEPNTASSRDGPGDSLIIAFDRPELFWRHAHFLNDLAEIGIHALKFGEQFPGINKSWGQYLQCARAHGLNDFYIDHRYDENPQQMGGAIEQHREIHAKYLSINTACGRDALEVAVNHCGRSALVATTVDPLTPEGNVKELYGCSVEKRVAKLAKIAADTGIQAVSSSGYEISALNRSRITRGLTKIVSGIRLPGYETEFEGRFMTPAQALSEGADKIVVGTALTEAESFEKALDVLLEDIT